MGEGVHVELEETGGAEGVAAVDHDARKTFRGVVGTFAEGTVLLVEQTRDEGVDFCAEKIGRVLGLLEKESGGVLQLFHRFKYIGYGSARPQRYH
jgi:hypothetical protein